MTRNISLWRKFLICILSALMISALTLGVVTITAKAADRTYTSAEFQSFLQYTRVQAENGQPAYVITGFEYIAGDGEKGIFGTSETNPVVIPAIYPFESENGLPAPVEDSLPVIGIAQGVFAGYPLQYVEFQQLERKAGDSANDAIFEKFSKFVLADANDGWSFTMTAADYGTAMLSIGGYDINGKKLDETIINGDAEYLSGVFQGCQDLVTVVLPGTVQEMGPSIFNQSNVQYVKSKSTLGGLTVLNTTYNGTGRNIFQSMQGLLFLKRIPYRAFYYSQKLVTLVFPDYERAAEFTRLSTNDKSSSTYFVPVLDGMNRSSATTLAGLNEKIGLNELGEEAFYYTNNNKQLNKSLTGFPDIDTSKVKAEHLYFAGITKMGGESMQKMNLRFDMGKYVAPGTVENLPGGDGSGNLVAWSSSAPNRAVSGNLVFNTATQKICGFNYTWGGSDAAITGSITIPSTVGGLAVTGISDGAFTATSATSLSFNSGMSKDFKEIGATTFRSSQLASITNLPDSIEKIAFHAFEQCSKLTSVTTASTHVDTTVTGSKAFIMPESIKQIDHRAFRSTQFETIYFPGNGDNGTFNIAATAFTESTSITSMYFAGWNGSAYQQIIPNNIENWPWSANKAKMHYNTSTTGFIWAELAAAQTTDSTGIWKVYYNSSNPDEAYLMGVNWSLLQSQGQKWYYSADYSTNGDYYKDYYVNGSWTINRYSYDLTLPETLTVNNRTVTITGIGAPQGDVSFFADNTISTQIQINKLTIPKYAREVTSVTFRTDKVTNGLKIDILEFAWDRTDRENTGVQYIRTSAFGAGTVSDTNTGAGIRYLYLPEYSLKKIERTAFTGHDLRQSTLVIPGNVESIDATAFQSGAATHQVSKIYVMQYSTTPSDGVYDLMSGKYNNYGLSGAGSMGLTKNGSAIPVYFVDQFRPEYYEIGQVNGKWQALVAKTNTDDNHGAYELPYVSDGATPQYVHPMLNPDGSFSGKVEIRFGVRLLLQNDMGRVDAVTSLQSGVFKTEAQKLGSNSSDSSWGTDFYFVHLEEITENGTYTFRVQFRNEKLVDALIENHFDYFTGQLFVNEFSIDVNAFATVTFSHALAMDIDDNALLPDMQTSDGTVALYSGYAYEYETTTVKNTTGGGTQTVYRRVDITGNEDEYRKTSQIHLDTPKAGTFSNIAYAEFIGWTTDTTTAGALQLEIPDEYSSTRNPTSTFFKAGPDTGDDVDHDGVGDGYPLDVLLGKDNTTNNARLYSVFRYVINHDVDLNSGDVDQRLSWIYGENPITSKYVGTDIGTPEQNGRIPTLPVNVTGGYLTLVKLEDGEQVVYKSVQVGVGEFNNALGTVLSPDLPVGTYKLYGGKLEDNKSLDDLSPNLPVGTYKSYSGKLEDNKSFDDLSPITAWFEIVKLNITVSGVNVSEAYGEHTISNATSYVAGQVAISPTDVYKARVSIVPDDHDSILALSTNFKDAVTYPGVGSYEYTYDLSESAKKNYELTYEGTGDVAEIIYTVTQRSIDITAAGLVTDDTDITQPNSRTYSWIYNGVNFNTDYYNTFEVSNYADGENWEGNTPAYKYVWYKANEIGEYVVVSDSSSIKDAGKYLLYIQWTDYNYIIDSVNRTVHGAASAEGNRRQDGSDLNDNPIYNVLVCEVEIYQATLKITVENYEFTYDGNEHGADVKVIVTAVNETESFTVTGSDLADITYINDSSYQFTDAGTHTVSYSLVNSVLHKDYLLNYNPVYNEKYEVIIKAAQITVSSTAENNTKEYDGAVFDYSFEYKDYTTVEAAKLIGDGESGNVVKYQFYANGTWGNLVDAANGIQPINVGNYIVRVYIQRNDGGTNYIIKDSESELYFEYSFSITAYDLSKEDRVTATDDSKDFNANSQAALPEIFKVTGSDGNELEFENGKATDGDNGNEVTLLYSYNGLNWLNAGALPEYRNVGTYTIYFRISATKTDSSYTYVNYAEYVGSYTFEIKAVEFSSFTDDKTVEKDHKDNISGKYNRNPYGNEVNVTPTGLRNDGEFENGLTIVYEYSTDSDKATWLTSQSVPQFVNAGTYYVRYTVSHINYYYADGSDKVYKYVGEYTIKIEQVELTFEPTVKQYTYNGSEQGAFPFTVTGLVEGEGNTAYQLQFWTTENKPNDGSDALLTDMPTHTNAGMYTVYYQVVDGGNYYSEVCDYTLIILPAKISATAYDSTLIYNGTAQYSGVRFTPTIDSLPPMLETGELNFGAGGILYVYVDAKGDVSVSENSNESDKTLVYTLTLSDNGYKDVGEYAIDVDFVGGGNFAIDVSYTDGEKTYDATYHGSYSFAITHAIIRLETLDSATYNATAQEASLKFVLSSNVTISDLANDVNLNKYTVEYRLKGADDNSWSEVAPTNAGTYEVRVTLNSSSNYKFEGGTTAFTQDYVINPFNIGSVAADFTATIDDVTYTGSTAQLTIRSVSVVLIQGSNGRTELKAGTDNVSSYDYTVITTQVLVGQGTAIFTGVGNYTGTAEAKFNVIPRRIKVELQLQSTVYGEAIVITTEQDVGWQYAYGSDKIVSGDSLGLIIEIADSDTLNRDAAVGFYALKVSYTNPNYLVTFVFNDENADVEYVKTLLYANADGTDYYIGALKDEDWFGDESKEPTATSDEVETLYSITLRIINVVISSQSVQYGDDFTGIGEIRLDSSTVGSNSPFYINSSNGTGTPIVGTDTVTIRFTTSADVGDGVGYYPIYVAGGGSNGPANNVQKYQITFSGDWNPDLNSNPLKALPDGYDSRYTYGSDGSITNYGAGVLEIVEREITVTADGATVVYGEAMPEIEELTKDRTSGDGDAIYGSDELDFTIVVGAEQGDPVGDYPISVTVKESNTAKNYKFTYVNGTLTIVKRAVTITIADNSSTYGDKVTSLGTEYGTGKNWTAARTESSGQKWTSDAIYNGDTTKLGIKFTLGSYNDTSLAGGSLNAGEYTITGSVEGDVADNYDITWVNGEFTVNKAELKFEPITKYFTYNGTAQGVFNISASGLKNGESDSAYRLEYWTDSDDTRVNSMPTFKDADTYTVSFIVADGSNYTSDEYYYTVIITPAQVSAEAIDSSLVYNGAAQYSGVSFRPTIQNLPPMIETGMDFGGGNVLYVYEDEVSAKEITGKTLIYTLTLKEGDYKNVGTYYIEVKFAENGNFAFAVDGDTHIATYTGSYSFEITPATITVAAMQSSVIYDGQEHKVDPKFTNVLNASAIPATGDYSLADSYVSNYFNNNHDGYKNVGDYTVTVTLTNGNFKFADGGNTATYTYSITPLTLSANILDNKEYNGEDQRPTSISFTSESLEVDKDYQLVYSDGSFTDVGQYVVTVWLLNKDTEIPSGTEAARSYLYGGNFAFNGSGNSYYYSRSLNFTIYAYDLNEHKAYPTWNEVDGTLSGDVYEYVFKFAAWEPITGGKVEGHDLAVGRHFTATYTNNINVGEATVVLSGIGNFTGTAEFNFNIVPASLGNITVSGTSGQYTFSDEQADNTTANSVHFLTVATLSDKYSYNGVVLTLPLSLAYRYDTASATANQTLVVDVHFAVTYYRQNTDGSWTALNSGDDVKNVGVYRAYLTATGENYDGHYLIEFEIIAAEVTVDLAEITQDKDGKYTVVYDGYAHRYGVIFSADGGVIPVSGGYTVEYIYSSDYFGDDSNGYRNSGTYTVTVEITSGNFVWATNAGADKNGKVYLTYEITPAEVTSATLSPETGVYSGIGHDVSNNVIYVGETRTPNNSINTKDNVPVDTVSYTYVTAAGSSNALIVDGLPVNVGKYKVTATLGYDAANHANGGGNLYFAQNSDGTYVYTYELEYEITPAIISASAASGELDYNGDKQHSNVRFTGIGVLPEDSDVFDLNSANWNENTNTYSVEGGIYTLTFDGYSSENGYFDDHADYSNVGTYTVTVTLNDGGNFKFADGYTATYSYKITPALVSLNNLTEAFEYNDKNQAPTASDVSFTPGSNVNNPSYDYRVTPPGGDYSAVGQYTALVQLGKVISGTFVEGGNFAFRKSGQDYDYTSNLTYSIRAFRLTDDNTDLYDVVVTSLENLPDAWVQGTVYTYTSSAIAPIESAVVNFSDNSNKLLGSSDYSLFYASNINAGTASVTVSGYGNYTGSFTLNFTITPKSLTDEDITHTDIGNVVYSGEEFSYAALTVSYNGRSLVEGTHYNVEFYDEDKAVQLDGAPVNAGTYYLLVSAVEGGNYADYFWIEFTIGKAVVKVVASGVTEIEYDGAAHELDYYFIVANSTATLEAKDYTVAYGYDGTKYGFDLGADHDGFKNSGVYTLTISLTDEGNKNFKFAEDDGVVTGNVFTYEITPRTVSARFSADATYYYDTNVLNARITFTHAGIQPTADQYTLLYSTDGENYDVDPINAGIYFVKLQLLNNNFRFNNGTAQDPDYSYESDVKTAAGGNFEILPSAINIYFTSTGSTYDGNRVTLKDYINLVNASGTGNSVVPSMDNVSVYYLDAHGEHKTEATNAGEYYVSLIINPGKQGSGHEYDNINFVFRVTNSNSFISEQIADASDKLVYTITPARISLEAFADAVYNGAEQGVTFRFFNEHGEYVDPADVAFTPTYEFEQGTNAKVGDNGIPLNAGTYKVRVVLAQNGNYMFGVNRIFGTLTSYVYESESYYVIQALELRIEDVINLEGDGIVKNDKAAVTDGKYSTKYDGTQKKPTPTVQVELDTGLYTLTGDDYSVAYAENTHASYSYRMGILTDYIPYVYITGSGNYFGEVSMIFRIYQANLSFELESNGGIYTGQPHEISVKSFINVDGGYSPKVSEVGSYSFMYYTLNDEVKSSSFTPPIYSGTYFVEITLDSYEGNYYVLSTNDYDGRRPFVEQDKYAKYASYIVGQLGITVTVTGNEVSYLAMPQVATITLSTTDGLQGVRMPNYTVEYKENSENAKLLDNLPYNAGKYLITITIDDIENYFVTNVVTPDGGGSIDAANVVTAYFTINRALVKAYVVSKTATYDGTEYYLTSRNMLIVTSEGASIYNQDLVGDRQSDIFHIQYTALNGETLAESGHPINAGNYDVTIVLSSNFEWDRGDDGFVSGSQIVEVVSDSVASFEFEISPAIVHVELLNDGTVTYKSAEFKAYDYINVYNSTNPELVPTPDSLADEGDVNTYTVTADRALLNAGSYKLTVTINGGNYLIYVQGGDNAPEQEYDFTINPSIVTVNYADDSKIYDGQQWILSELLFTNTLAETDEAYKFVLPVNSDYAIVTEGDFTKVGTHTFTIKLEENGNFSFETAAYQFVYVKVITYTIELATITVNTEEGSWFYGRQGNYGDTLLSGYSDQAYYRPVEDYTNYDGAYKLIISPDSFKLVDGTTAEVLILDVQTADGTYGTDQSGNYALLTVGTYTISVRVNDPNGNHSRAEFVVVVKINPNEIKITLKDDAKITKTYGQVGMFNPDAVLEEFFDLIVDISGIPEEYIGSNATLEEGIAWLKAIGLRLTSNVGLDSYSSAGYLRASSYNILINVDDDNNSAVFSHGTNIAVGLYVVEKLEVEVDWGMYFSDYVYDGTNINDRATTAARALLDGIVIGNALTFDDVSFRDKSAGYYPNGVWSETARDVGDYYLIVQGIEGADANNYSFELAYNTFNIVRRRVDINLTSSNRSYGEEYRDYLNYTVIDDVLSDSDALREFILNLLELQLNGKTVVGYPQVGELYTVTTKAPTPENGLKTVDGIVTVDYLGNFTLYFTQDGTYTATPRIVTVTASASSIYGDDIADVASIVWSGTNFAVGEDESVLNITFVITQSDSADAAGVYLKEVGTYTNGVFVQSICDNNNYRVVFEGSYTVLPRPITIVPESAESVYGTMYGNDMLPSLANWQWSLSDGSTLAYDDELSSILVSFYYEDLRGDNSVLPNVGDLIYIRGTVNDGSNSNYTVSFDTSVQMSVISREVTIVVGRSSDVYGNLHIGDIITLNYAANVEGYSTWTYDEGSLDILSDDLINLAFYLETYERTENLYAPVGAYKVAGSWGIVTGNATAIRNYTINFQYNYDEAFTITEAKITSGSGVSWERNGLTYRQGDDGDYSESAGWYAMTIDPASYIILVGDYTIQDSGDLTFKEYVAGSYIEYFAYAGRYDSSDKGVIIRYYLPEFTAIGDAMDGEWYYDSTLNIWRVHSVGTWAMRIEVIQANHETAYFTLTCTIVQLNAVVTLLPGATIELDYGYEYFAPLGRNGEYTAAQLEELMNNELTKLITEFVLGPAMYYDSPVIAISGIDELGDGIQAWYELLREYCHIEIVPAEGYLSSSGRLIVGVYDIRIVANRNSIFSVSLQQDGPTAGIDRVIVNKVELTINWADEQFEEDGTQVVTVGDDAVTYLYTGNVYDQAPTFRGTFDGDDISALTFEYRLPDGTVIKEPRNVLEGGLSYTIVVLDILGGEDAANYKLPDGLLMALHIVPREITVTIADVTSTYGDYTDEYIATMLTDISAYATASWLGAGDSIEALNIVLTKVTGLNVGDYTISGNYSNGNYNVTFITGTYNISPKAVTVTIGDIERTFGEGVADLNANYIAEGVLEGETLDMTFEIVGATYYKGYLEVSDDAAGYAIVGYDNDSNYEIIFVGNWSDGKSGIYKVNKAANAWLQEFLFDAIVEGDEPLATDLPIAKYGSAVIEYYYDEAMTERVEVPVSQLAEGTYYAKAYVAETKNFTGVTVEKHVFEVLTSVIPYNRDVDILGIVILLAVETLTLAYGLIFVRRRKDKNNNEEGR